MRLSKRRRRGMNLGAKIRVFRKNKNMTIKQLAEATSLSSGFISNIENDVNSPSISNLQQICKALDINIVELIQSRDNNSYIVRNKERKEIFKSNDDTVKFELVSNRSEEHTSELQSRQYLVCRLLLDKKQKYERS